jgi:signal transduction histidine kinase
MDRIPTPRTATGAGAEGRAPPVATGAGLFAPTATSPVATPPPHVAVLRFGRSGRGRAVCVASALLLETAVLLVAAQHAEPGHFRGVPGVAAVAVACTLAALSGPVVGGVVALGAAVVFLVSVADGVFGSWLVLALWPAVAAVAGLVCDRLVDAEEERERLVARLVESERRQMATQIVGGIGHHFNNHLTVILGYADLARLGLDEERNRDAVAALDELRAAGERMSGITTLLFVLTDGSAGPTTTIDVSARVRSAEQRLAEVVAPRRLDLRTTDDPCPVRIEAGSLELMLVELARNAAEASAPQADVRVTAACVAGEVIIEIVDHGRGMSDAERRGAFEPFYSTKPPKFATGLGLPVSQAIAERAGGRVELVSRPGEGTTVRVRLPLAEEDAGPHVG